MVLIYASAETGGYALSCHSIFDVILDTLALETMLLFKIFLLLKAEVVQ